MAQKTSVALVSLGCPKNLVDSERMLAILAEAGCIVGAPVEQADVVVINTCGFLSSARQESLAVIREALGHKRLGRARRVVVAGCMANRDGEALYDLAPGIDAVVGVHDRRQILNAVLATKRFTRIGPHGPVDGLDAGPAGAPQADFPRFRLTPRHTAYLRIAEGCSRRCTFCTIPSIRGPYRSRPASEILAEARQLIADGATEINLIAQDTTRYGLNLPSGHADDGPRDLPALLRALDALDGARWIRLMYAYPNRFSDALIDAIAECPHVVKYVDMPLQHINDTILRRMGRGVTRQTTQRLLETLRKRIPNLAIRTTFIVGFPGETQGQFAELLSFVKDFRFDAMGVFEFSAEPGTPAADMPRQVTPAVKAERAKALMLAQQRLAFAAGRRAVGRGIEVLVDGVDSAGRCVGRHAGQAPEIDGICIFCRRRTPGRFVQTTVAAAEGYDLIVD